MTPAWWWSWLLASGHLTALLLLAEGKRAGWYVGLAFQAVWFTYAVATRQWGFVASSCVFAVVNARGLIKSRRKDQVDTPHDGG